MIDVGKQIAYWRTSASEDWDVAAELVRSGHMRHGLFFAHLVLGSLPLESVLGMKYTGGKRRRRETSGTVCS